LPLAALGAWRKAQAGEFVPDVRIEQHWVSSGALLTRVDGIFTEIV
jgi:hypothetical protein